MLRIYTSLAFLMLSHSMVWADMNIINNGNIVVHKVYSENAQTLVVHKAKKIYVCSVDGKNSKCILSKLVRNNTFN